MSEIGPTVGQRKFHNALLEHSCAPLFNFTSSDMLTPQRLQAVQEFEQASLTERFWLPGQHPDWLALPRGEGKLAIALAAANSRL